MKQIIITSFALLSACLLCAQSGTTDSLQLKIHDLSAQYEAAGYHGVVIVAKNGISVQQDAFGFASQQPTRAMHLSALFKTESAGKMFTAVSVMQQVDKGKIDLDKSVLYYLPQTRIKHADKMTIRHLLSHQSGLTSPWENEAYNFEKHYTREQQWDFVENNSLAFDTPGTGVYYSSSAYIVLAAIIEKVTGLSFEKYCNKHIFKPAGMRSTSYSMDSASFFARGTRPYRWVGTKTFTGYPMPPVIEASGAGGWISNAQDFLLFAQALLNGKLVGKHGLETLLTPAVDMPPGKYGFGFEIYPDRMVTGIPIYGHNGGGMGYSCDLFFEPNSKTIVVTMLNMYFNSRYVTRNFFQLAFGLKPSNVTPDPSLMLFDAIEQNGLDDFSKHPESYFEKIGMPKPSPYFLISIADGYEALKRNDDKEKYLEILKGIFPDNAVVYLQLGDIAAMQRNNTKAKGYYEKARDLAAKNEPRWQKEAETKLAALPHE